MKVEARERLLADAKGEVENKQQQIEILKKGLPSIHNKRAVSPNQQDNTRKRINVLKNQIIDIRTRERNKPKEA